MEIHGRSTYHNSIYSAIVVNADPSQDPFGANRIQIYIPSLQYEYEALYTEYMKDGNKPASKHFSKFPWATTMISGLKEGTVVFGSFINNKNYNYIIIGIDINNPQNEGVGGAGPTDLTNIFLSGDILNLLMPIMLMNEISLPLNSWPDNIPDTIRIAGKDVATFGFVNGNDNGAWSIGLIQWRATRAYDLLYDICRRKSNWKSCFTDKSLDLCVCLEKSLSQGSTANQRYKFNAKKVKANSEEERCIQALLTSVEGKQVQKEKASEDAANYLSILQNEPYKISNPAVLIYVADIMNQYGSGIKSKTKAAEICKNNSLTMMQQFEQFVEYWSKETNNAYKSRRDRTADYIRNLEKQGKLQTSNLVSIGELVDNKWVPELGEYLWPLKDSTRITCYWGEKSMSIPYTFKYNTGQTTMGYSSIKGFHYGTDFGSSKGVDGDPVIAVGSGTVQYVCGNTGAQGNCIGIQMDKNKEHYFVYMHLCKKPDFKVGDKVRAGQVIGYMGTTGNSTGTHLHLGLHLGGAWPDKDKRIDPLPYLGKKAYM